MNSRVSLGDTAKTLPTWYSTPGTLTSRHCSGRFQGLNTLLFQAHNVGLRGVRIQAPFSWEGVWHGWSRRRGPVKGPQTVCWTRKLRQIASCLGGANTKGGGDTGGPGFLGSHSSLQKGTKAFCMLRET